MKWGFIAAVFFLAPTLWAHDEIVCEEQLPDLIQQIRKSPSCWEAVDIAWHCSYGTSSEDRKVVEAAKRRCQPEHVPRSDVQLLKTMTDRCQKTCVSDEGASCGSVVAFCELRAVVFIYELLHGTN